MVRPSSQQASAPPPRGPVRVQLTIDAATAYLLFAAMNYVIHHGPPAAVRVTDTLNEVADGLRQQLSQLGAGPAFQDCLTALAHDQPEGLPNDVEMELIERALLMRLS